MMGNSHTPSSPLTTTPTACRFAGRGFFALLTTFLLTGCTTTKDLDDSRTALTQRQYSQTITHADAYLKDHPTGDGAAEALYLRGRAIEEQPAPSTIQQSANLQTARMMYDRALAAKPSPKLAAYIHASIGNIAFLQDDYSTAYNHFTLALDNLDVPDLRATALYRIGISQQRLGNFIAADHTFARIIREFPTVSVATAARDHMGARAFYVQLASYQNTTTAQQSAQSLLRQGYHPFITRNARGLNILRIGPYSSWSTATRYRRQLLPQFKDALIVP